MQGVTKNVLYNIQRILGYFFYIRAEKTNAMFSIQFESWLKNAD